MAEKLELNRVLKAMNAKDRDFYDNLTDDERKSLTPFLMIRYASSVQGITELEHYYLASSNVHANKYFFDLARHPKLQWLCLTTISPGMGNQRHQWIPMKKKDATTKKGKFSKRTVLLDLFPTMKESDIDLLVSISTDDEIKDYVRSLGNET